MNTYRPDLPPLPDRMRGLPIDERGFPVPWFVYEEAPGKWDFRVIGPGKRETAWNNRTCWLCGQRLGTYGAFAIGPMCGVNQVTSEPASHRECAEYAVRACPFLTRPLASYNHSKPLPEGSKQPDGYFITRNPGVALLWVTKDWRPFKDGKGGFLFRLGEPREVVPYARGRVATLEEVMASVDGGMPLLLQAAELDGPDAIKELRRQAQKFGHRLGQFYATQVRIGLGASS
jgi:hypothetical protein